MSSTPLSCGWGLSRMRSSSVSSTDGLCLHHCRRHKTNSQPVPWQGRRVCMPMSKLRNCGRVSSVREQGYDQWYRKWQAWRTTVRAAAHQLWYLIDISPRHTLDKTRPPALACPWRKDFYRDILPTSDCHRHAYAHIPQSIPSSTHRVYFTLYNRRQLPPLDL